MMEKAIGEVFYRGNIFIGEDLTSGWSCGFLSAVNGGGKISLLTPNAIQNGRLCRFGEGGVLLLLPKHSGAFPSRGHAGVGRAQSKGMLP